MKTVLEEQDVQAIAKSVVEMLAPLLKSDTHRDGNDTIFKQEELAKYLKVSRSWIDQKISSKEIPFFKCGKYPRFRKYEIDKWVSKNTIYPVPPLLMVKKVKKIS